MRTSEGRKRNSGRGKEGEARARHCNARSSTLTSTFHSTKATRRLPGLDGRQNAGIVRQMGLQHAQRHPRDLPAVSSSASMRRNGLTSSILYSLREAHSKNPSFAISCAPDTFQSRSFFMVGARSSRKDCMAHRYASTVPRRNCVSPPRGARRPRALFGRSPANPSHSLRGFEVKRCEYEDFEEE